MALRTRAVEGYTAALDAEINPMLHQLYRLTAEEIAIMEGTVVKKFFTTARIHHQRAVFDDERLKQAGPGSYFDELLARIRDIRSSDKIFCGQ